MITFEEHTISQTDRDDIKGEQRRVWHGIAWAFIVCVAVMSAAHVFVPHLLLARSDDLQSLLEVWVLAILLVLGWVIFAIGAVSHGRRHSMEDVRGSAYSAPSSKLAVPVAFLQNTLEQSFVMLFSQLALVIVLRTRSIPIAIASALLFSIGRAALVSRYSKGAGARSFGMALTALPSLVAFVLAVCVAAFRN